MSTDALPGPFAAPAVSPEQIRTAHRKQTAELDQLRAGIRDIETRLAALAAAPVQRDADGREFVYVTDIATALRIPTT